MEPLTATGTVRISLLVVDDQPFDPSPGQFVAVDFVGADTYRRSPYCLLDVRSRRFEILVRVVEQGPVSRFLGHLVPGDLIGFRGPTGRSMIPPGKGKIVALVTGVGISPLVFLARRLKAEPQAELPIRIFWGLRLIDDICLMQELSDLAHSGAIDLNVSLSRPPQDWPGLRGRVTVTAPGRLRDVANTWFYLVSNGRMVAEMRSALEEVGVERRRIYCESFFDHRYRPDPATVAAIVARFPVEERPGLDLEKLIRR